MLIRLCSSSHSLATACALILAAGSASAQNNVTFIDGGYAEICEAVAKTLDEPSRQVITGSRLGISPLEVCTLAIEAPENNREQRAGSYNNRAVLKFDLMDFDGALADLDAAIAEQPTMGQAHAHRGYVPAAQKRWQDAIAAFDEAVTLGTDEPARVHFNRGIVHEELGQTREAYFDYLKASELAPEWDQPKSELTRFTVRR